MIIKVTPDNKEENNLTYKYKLASYIAPIKAGSRDGFKNQRDDCNSRFYFILYVLH